MPIKTVTRPQDDAGLLEVEAVRTAVKHLHRLVGTLAIHNHTGLICKVEDALAYLSNAANRAEEEIRDRQRVITK